MSPRAQEPPTACRSSVKGFQGLKHLLKLAKGSEGFQGRLPGLRESNEQNGSVVDG